MTDPTSTESTPLIGHEKAEAQLLHDCGAGKLAHGWLISGPRGIGKATLAHKFAGTLLTSAGSFEPEESADSRIAARSHGGLLVVEPLWDEKKEEYAREISVEQARGVGQFFSLTPGEGQWRVVIIDTADALNVNGANALLKILEEPPAKSVLLLISHAPGKLLPTLRSRCRHLKLAPPNESQFASIMRQTNPTMYPEEINALGALAAYAPGIAQEMHKDGSLAMYSEVAELLSTLPAIDPLKLHAFSEQLAGGGVHAKWRMLTRLLLCLLERACKQAAGASPDPISSPEYQSLRRMAALHPAAIWALKWQQCVVQFLLAETRHLDYKQFVIAFFHSLSGTEGFQIGHAA